MKSYIVELSTFDRVHVDAESEEQAIELAKEEAMPDWYVLCVEEVGE